MVLVLVERRFEAIVLNVDAKAIVPGVIVVVGGAAAVFVVVFAIAWSAGGYSLWFLLKRKVYFFILIGFVFLLIVIFVGVDLWLGKALDEYPPYIGPKYGSQDVNIKGFLGLIVIISFVVVGSVVVIFLV